MQIHNFRHYEMFKIMQRKLSNLRPIQMHFCVIVQGVARYVRPTILTQYAIII